MKNKKKAWQHLHNLKLSEQQQQRLFYQITKTTTAKKHFTKNSWKILSLSLLFLAVLSILLLSFVHEPIHPPTTVDATKTIDRVYVKKNSHKDTFIAKASCLYVPQQCYTNHKTLVQLEKDLANASPVSISPSPSSANYYDVFIRYDNGTEEKWKVLNNNTFWNIETEQAVQLDGLFYSLWYYDDEKSSIKILMGNIFIFLASFLLWIAKKRMPNTERRFFAATVEHAIANVIMLILFGGTLLFIYLLQHMVHAMIIYSLFMLYSIAQIYYRKKAGEPQAYLIVYVLIQLCLAIGFTYLYVGISTPF